MPPIQGRPTRRTRAKHGGEKPSIESVLLAAMERLLERGHTFGALTVEQLTKEAGIARGTFYLHFRDKGELVERIMGEFADEWVRSNGEWLREGDTFSPASVHKAVAGTVKTFKKHQAIIAAINETAPHDAKVADYFQKMVESICLQSRRSFATVRRSGDGKKGANDEVADMLTWMVILYTARMVGQREGAALTRMAKGMGYICSNAIFLDAE